MKLREFVEKLDILIEACPEILDSEVIYSSDDEGNYFGYVNYTPSIGFYDEENREYLVYNTKIQFDPLKRENLINVVCIN